MNFLNVSDFANDRVKVNIFQTATFQNEINTYEREFMARLLGGKLSNLVYSNLVNTEPIDPLILEFWNEITYTECVNHCTCANGEKIQSYSMGIKKLAKNYIIWKYTRLGNTKATTVGAKIIKGENSESAIGQNNFAYYQWNEMCLHIELVQLIAKKNYPSDYCGEPFKLLYPW